MLNRFTSLQIVIAVGAVAAISLGLMMIPQSEKEIPSNAAVPEALRVDAHQGTTLTWVIPQNAFTFCRQPAYALRRIKERYGDEVTLVVWYEAHRRSDVQRILRRERLSATLLPLKSNAYVQWLGQRPEPSLHLIKGNHVVKTWPYVSSPIQAEEIMALL